MLISFEEIDAELSKRNIKLTGALHIGAHDCEEIVVYDKMKIAPQNIVWIDAFMPKVQEAKNRGIPNVYHAVITDKDDSEVIFNVSNNIQSSSVLEFETHAIEHPYVHYVNKIKQNTITIDTFFERNNIDGSKYNFWNFDIQGAELMALKGSVKHIQYPSAIYLEVNEKELYKNCGMIQEIDEFLQEYKFARVLTSMTRHGWGDALYVKL